MKYIVHQCDSCGKEVRQSAKEVAEQQEIASGSLFGIPMYSLMPELQQPKPKKVVADPLTGWSTYKDFLLCDLCAAAVTNLIDAMRLASPL